MTVQQQRIRVPETHGSSEINPGGRGNEDDRHGTLQPLLKSAARENDILSISGELGAVMCGIHGRP